MNTSNFVSALGWICFALPALAQSAPGEVPLQRKQVSAPASDILSGRLSLPDRWQNPETIRANLLEFENTGMHAVVSVWAPKGELSVVPIWAQASTDTWEFRMGHGPWVAWPRLVTVGWGHHEQVDPSDAWTAMSPERLTLHVHNAGPVSIRIPSPQTGSEHVIIGDTIEATLQHGLSTYRLQQGQPIAILASLDSPSEPTSILSAQVRLETTQETRTLTLFDDGEHSDRRAGDGIWGAAVPADLLGEISATTQIVAADSQGQRFSRTGLQTFEIDSPSVALTGQVDVRSDLADAWTIDVPALVATNLPYLHFAAEVWGTDSEGQAQPICWLARQCQVAEGEPRTHLELEFDKRWLQSGDFQAPFELRHVRVQDPDSWTVLEEQDHWPVSFPAQAQRTGNGAPAANFTFRSSPLSPSSSTPAPNPNLNLNNLSRPLFGLMLVHGWCSSGGVWPTSQFTHPLLVFHDPDANRSHDQFAQRMATLGSQNRSFGIIGHSQGGPAALQLRTYYVSGLDRAQGGRPIQSLASPYQGTPLAGLGFFLCGTNTDLGTSASAAWLANIPSSVRDEVYYYTTANSGSACNFATNWFLTNPEDGTVEQFRGQLPGAHNMGHVTGWCHTTGMSNPAGYQDAARNAIMNQEAAH